MRAQSLAKIHRGRSSAKNIARDHQTKARNAPHGASPASHVIRKSALPGQTTHTLADGPRGRNRSLFEEENSRATSRMPTIWCRSSPNEVKERIVGSVEGAIARIDARAAGLRRGREEEIPEIRGNGWESRKTGEELTCCRGAATPSWSWCWRPCRWRPRGPC